LYTTYYVSARINVDVLYNIEKLSNVIKDCGFPNKTFNKRINYQAQRKPWLDITILNQISKKHRLYKQCLKLPLNTKLKDRYVKLRNSLCTELRQAKENYFKRRVSDCSNPQAIWQLLNNEVLSKNKKATKVLPNNLNSNKNEKAKSSDVEIAEGLNQYFTCVGPNLAKKFATENLPLENKTMEKSFHNFQFTPCEENELLAIH